MKLLIRNTREGSDFFLRCLSRRLLGSCPGCIRSFFSDRFFILLPEGLRRFLLCGVLGLLSLYSSPPGLCRGIPLGGQVLGPARILCPGIPGLRHIPVGIVRGLRNGKGIPVRIGRNDIPAGHGLPGCLNRLGCSSCICRLRRLFRRSDLTLGIGRACCRRQGIPGPLWAACLDSRPDSPRPSIRGVRGSRIHCAGRWCLCTQSGNSADTYPIHKKRSLSLHSQPASENSLPSTKPFCSREKNMDTHCG